MGRSVIAFHWSKVTNSKYGCIFFDGTEATRGSSVSLVSSLSITPNLHRLAILSQLWEHFTAASRRRKFSKFLWWIGRFGNFFHKKFGAFWVGGRCIKLELGGYCSVGVWVRQWLLERSPLCRRINNDYPNHPPNIYRPIPI